MICGNCSKLIFKTDKRLCKKCNMNIYDSLSVVCHSCSVQDNVCAVCLKKQNINTISKGCKSCGR